MLRQAVARGFLSQGVSAQYSTLSERETGSSVPREACFHCGASNNPFGREEGPAPNPFSSHQNLISSEPFAICDESDLPTGVSAEPSVEFHDSTESVSELEGPRQSFLLGEQKFPYNHLESPPTRTDSFEWDEQSLSSKCALEHGEAGLNRHVSVDDPVGDDSSVTDGMASLTMGDNETGYLGVASGAALLKMIDLSATGNIVQRRRTTHRRSTRHSSNAIPSSRLPYGQPNPNRHITTAMIDAYFRHYNTSYPIVHEPTFRAQYSEVIDRPNGNCWKVLAYVIAAIGVFSTATSTEDMDILFFAQAKSLMRWTYMDTGNLTLVQALTLMSNYLQKRDKPNSGYNYAGLALRMAMGIGLHKEFQGWAIQPLKMEIRRRVWWCICVFDIGATITFGRPISWPRGGIDIGFPSNVHDYVRLELFGPI